MGKMQNNLTESLEDYLLEIFKINNEKKIVRIKDIAKKRHVKLPSVVRALDELASRKYVKHEKYGHVELTDYGVEKAREIYEKHKKIFNFFHNILGVDEVIAESDAHKMEHFLHEDSIERLTNFTNFFERMPKDHLKIWHHSFSYFMKTGKYHDLKNLVEGDDMHKTKEKTLEELDVGKSCKIVRVKDGIGSLKSKLLDMGVYPGTTVKIEKKAPLGDPIDVKILGYHLSLRNEEARNIIVEDI